MKKEYINPEMETINIQPVVLQSASNPDVNVNPEETPIDAGSVGASQWFGDGDTEGW